VILPPAKKSVHPVGAGLQPGSPSAAQSRRASASPSAAQPLLPYPGESRRILGELETPSVKVEEMAFAPGLCVARHSHDTSNLIYVIAG